MKFKLSLTNKTHPEVEVKRIDFEKELVIFQNRDGWNMAPLKPIKGSIPTEDELIVSIEDVLGELKNKQEKEKP